MFGLHGGDGIASQGQANWGLHRVSEIQQNLGEPIRIARLVLIHRHRSFSHGTRGRGIIGDDLLPEAKG